MRKTFVTAFVALLVMLAVVSCDNIQTEENDDGFVTLGIDVGGTAGNGRSLIDAIAHDEGKYLEVIFKHGNDYFRAESPFALTNKLKIRIPIGAYYLGGPNDALLLIGRQKDGTLLAIGTLKNAVSSLTAISVEQTTTSIAFTVKSLEADIHAKTSATDFAIDESTPASSTIISTTDWTVAGTTRNGTYTLDDVSPCFQVPTGKTGIKATLNIQNLTGSGAQIILKSSPVTDPAVVFDPLSGAAAISASLSNSIGDSLGGTDKISFTFNSGTATAGYIVTFKIPVVAFAVYDSGTPNVNAGLKYALTWYIRGGTVDGLPDTTGSAKEGVALIVTASPRAYADISDIIAEWPVLP